MVPLDVPPDDSGLTIGQLQLVVRHLMLTTRVAATGNEACNFRRYDRARTVSRQGTALNSKANFESQTGSIVQRLYSIFDF